MDGWMFLLYCCYEKCRELQKRLNCKDVCLAVNIFLIHNVISPNRVWWKKDSKQHGVHIICAGKSLGYSFKHQKHTLQIAHTVHWVTCDL